METEISANKKKVVFIGGSVPREIISAFDCDFFDLDSVPFALSGEPTLSKKYIDETEKHMGEAMCGVCRTQLGAWLDEYYGVEPDMFVYNSLPCASFSSTYPILERFFGVPRFNFDNPTHLDGTALEYLVEQLESFIAFMEEQTGKRLNWEKMKFFMEKSNRENRAKKPKPQEGKKHRVILQTNMTQSNSDLLDWIERELDSTVLTDFSDFQEKIYFEHLDDRDDCLKTMVRRMQATPPLHGACEPVEERAELLDRVFAEFQPNVSIFLGHRTCKHIWAMAKIIGDQIFEKYGVPTLSVEFDCMDARYKSIADIKRQIKEYYEIILD